MAVEEIDAEGRSPLPAYNSVVASAKIMPPNRRLKPQYERWQDELWDYYDRLGEFESGVSWLANTMSRVRLVAAELVPGGDEPVPIDEGPAAEAVMRLAGGTGGQAQLMKEMTIHLAVPGEGWLVGEAKDDEEVWQVYSADELDVSGRNQYRVREGEDKRALRDLSSESVVVRFWDPHPRYGWQADSAARHAMGAMLELDLINKRIIAEIMSRLASNGILLYDKGKLSFGSTGETTGDPGGIAQIDPFAKILVDVASRGIKDPTSPEAVIPIPIGFDLADLTDVDPSALLQWIQVANNLDPKLLEERDSAVKRLATSLDMPAEVLLGMSGMNHWGAWQIEESGIKIHVSPKAELICFSLTTGYLKPTMKAAGAPMIGPNGGKLVIWYDPSEIVVRPDRSGNVISAYDRLEIPGRVLRREIGVSEEGDAPTNEELRDMVTKLVARQPNSAFAILAELGGPNIADMVNGAPEEGASEDGTDDAEGSEGGTPDTADDAPPVDDGPPVPTSLSDHELLAFLQEADRRGMFNGKGTYWAEADLPDDARVTPEKRTREDVTV